MKWIHATVIIFLISVFSVSTNPGSPRVSVLFFRSVIISSLTCVIWYENNTLRLTQINFLLQVNCRALCLLSKVRALLICKRVVTQQEKTIQGKFPIWLKKNYFDCIMLYKIGSHQNHGVVFSMPFCINKPMISWRNKTRTIE